MNKIFIPLPDSNLPIFHFEGEKDVLLYAPGYLVRVEKDNWQHQLRESDEWHKLEQKAQKAQEKPSSWEANFEPFSLNVYLNRLCNLNCIYCFSKPSQKNKHLTATSTDAIIAGAQVVVEHCKQKHQPMVLVIHGGGEPTMDNRLEPLVNYIKDYCKKNNVNIFTYLATNGVINPKKAERICQLFDLIGLSCDGPPEIQDLQRPLINGSKSSPLIERTVATFHRNQQAFEIRVTLTRNSWPQMVNIAQYFIKHIQPKGINVELSYLTATPAITEDDIDNFIDLYLSAQAFCEAAEIPWRSSAIRPVHHHRQYCHVLQNTLQIIPGDIATNCFLDNDLIESQHRSMQIGAFDQQSKNWSFDFPKIESLRNQILHDAQVCKDCIASSHCHRSCPDVCPLDKKTNLPDIHCHLNQRLFTEYLLRSGQTLAEFFINNQQPIYGREVITC